MKIIILIFNLCFVTLLFSQEKAIKVFKQGSKKEVILKENKRIKVKTLDGEKFSGKFKIVDHETIMIKDRKITFNQIEKIKRNPLGVSIITNVIFYYYGAALTGASIIIYAITGEAVSLLLAIPVALLIYGGSKSPNVLKGYKKSNNWIYEIVTISK